MSRQQEEIQRVKHVVDILMGAAYSDGHCDREEVLTIARILARTMHWEALPAEVVAHIRSFDYEAFDLGRTCAALELDEPTGRRKLLDLISEVVEADAVHDLGETDYIRAVAKYIGASKEEFEDLCVDLVVEEQESEIPPIPQG